MSKFASTIAYHLHGCADALELTDRQKDVLLAMYEGNGRVKGASKVMGVTESRVDQLLRLLPAKVSRSIMALDQRPKKPQPIPPPDRHPIDWRLFKPKIRRMLQDECPEPKYYEDLAFMYHKLKTYRNVGHVTLEHVAALIRQHCSEDYHYF